MPTQIPKLRHKRPQALALPDTPLTAHFSSYQMGPLTPAPLRSPPRGDTFGVDPLTPALARPPLRPFPSLPPPRRPGEAHLLLGRLASALQEERATGDARDLETQVYQLLGHSREDMLRYLAMHYNMREDQTLAREGDIKSNKPLYYLLLALSGRVAIGMGATFLEHEVMPGQPKEPGSTAPGRPPPEAGDPSRPISNVEVMGGAMLLAGGAIAAVGATYLFWRQARIKRPTRAACLAAAHITSLALAIIHSFVYEFVLFNRSADQLIILTAPSVVSAALYAYTVPNSLTAAETELGLMPIGTMDTRMELALILSALGAGLKELSPGLAAHHGTSSYIKQAVSISAAIASAGGLGLAFSNARNIKARLDRAKKLRERAARQSISEQSRSSSQVRRPTALLGHVRERSSDMPRPEGRPDRLSEDVGYPEESARPILRAVESQQSITPVEDWPSPLSARFPVVPEAPSGATRRGTDATDYFNLNVDS